MNKNDIINAIASESGLTKKDSDKAFSAAIKIIVQSLCQGEKIAVSGFGTFEVKEKAARNGKNPRTKETILIPASKVPVFKASKQLKDEVAG